MAEITKEKVVEFIEKMSVLELSKLVKELEEKFGVSAAAAVAAPAAAAASAPAEEKTQFDVILKSIGDKKINVIKEIRVATNLGLIDAKKMAESAGDSCKVKEAISKEEAEALVKKLKDAGADALLV